GARALLTFICSLMQPQWNLTGQWLNSLHFTSHPFSRRFCPKRQYHEHDGNELQVTQGFRTHVAKKLGHLLDSDSDSEMETRLREAAVSPPCSGQVKEKEMIAEGEEGQVVKKKKKKKRRQNPEESAQVDCARCPVKAQSNGEHGNVEQEQFKAKRKKKKKRQGNTMDEAMS
uniref:Protein CUSTOS n=1 Tax=Scophthalmus maximus TaxID=52904 RepID=A0A8D3CIF4_SCOMX